MEDKWGGDRMDWMEIDGRVLGRDSLEINEGLTLLYVFVVVVCFKLLLLLLFLLVLLLLV